MSWIELGMKLGETISSAFFYSRNAQKRNIFQGNSMTNIVYEVNKKTGEVSEYNNFSMPYGFKGNGTGEDRLRDIKFYYPENWSVSRERELQKYKKTN